MAHPGPILVRRRRAIVASALVAAIVLLVGAYLVLLGPLRAGGPSGGTVLKISGSGNDVSRHFTARSGWQIEWENTGSYFSFTIHGDVEFGQVITQNGPGNGITAPVPTGNFFIEVVAQGPWSLTVTQGD
jgi:hypothetical protein